MNETMDLSCAGLRKSYGRQQALDGVDLTLEKGKIYGLIGRNGAGKTTLLSLLSGQNPATAGSVQLAGEPVWENQPVLDHICFSREIMPTANGMGIGSLKVKEYLRMAAMYYPHWDKAYAAQLVETFGLDVKKRMQKLSKGMTSMVTIIVALASGADFTFLDEPVAGLDVVAREKFYGLLVENYTDTNRTFVISTHIIEEAAAVFEEVVIIDKGKLLLKENTEELISSAMLVSGRTEQVDEVCQGLSVRHSQSFGRSKTVVAFAPAGDSVAAHTAGHDVDVQPLNLQKVFVALCGEDA